MTKGLSEPSPCGESTTVNEESSGDRNAEK